MQRQRRDSQQTIMQLWVRVLVPNSRDTHNIFELFIEKKKNLQQMGDVSILFTKKISLMTLRSSSADHLKSD